MNKLLLFFLLFSAFAFSAPAKQADNYSAIFIDNMNVTTLVNHVSYFCQYADNSKQDAKAMLFGRRGNSFVSIPWKNIERVDFVEGGKKYNAVVKLKDKRVILIYADLTNAEYKGLNDFGGSFQINAEYVRAIIFQ